MNNENISSEKFTQYKKTKQYISQNCVLKTTMISNDLKKNVHLREQREVIIDEDEY